MLRGRGNDVVKIRHGNTTLATVLSTTGQPVPTSLAGPDGALYIGTLNFQAGPGGVAVYRLAPGSSTATVYADGRIEFGRHGQLYVSEFAATFGPDGPGPDGDVVVIPWGGGGDGRRILGAGPDGQWHYHGGGGVTFVFTRVWVGPPYRLERRPHGGEPRRRATPMAATSLVSISTELRPLRAAVCFIGEPEHGPQEMRWGERGVRGYRLVYGDEAHHHC